MSRQANVAGSQGREAGRDEVILLHGVWMRALALIPLQRRLQSAGFGVALFDYASLFGRPEATAARLRARMLRSQASRVHLVGHSLGGLVALQAVRGETKLPVGHIVCLGSPLNGSATARSLARWRFGGAMLGNSGGLLRDGIGAWDASRPVGVIAGSRCVGIGMMVANQSHPSDGTVSVAETRLPGITDHRVIAVSHTELPWSVAAADLTIEFLRNARFG